MLVLPCAVVVSGCDHGKSMGRVRGKVLYKDGSIPHGGVCVVSLQPAETTTAEIRKSASSAIEPDGSFDMMTRKPGDGVYYGNYVVTFTVRKAPNDTASLILPKYGSMAESPFKLTVDGNKDDLAVRNRATAGRYGYSRGQIAELRPAGARCIGWFSHSVGVR